MLEEVRMNLVLMSQFLVAACHRSLFVNVIDRLMTSDMCGKDMIGDKVCFNSSAATTVA